MDSQDSSAAPPPHQSLHHHLHAQQHQQQPPSAMLMGATQNQLQSQPTHHHHHHHHPNSYPHLQTSVVNNNNNIMRQQQQQQHQHQHQQQHQHQHQHHNPSSAAAGAHRFPFNSMVAASAAAAAAAAAAASKMDYSDGGGGGGGSSSPTGGGFNIEPSKKKRGRPRKYSPDAAGSSIALGLSPTPVTPASSVVGLGDSSGGGGGGTLSSETPSKKHRGRPPGSGKRQLDALGAAGIGFTPHVITVKAGEDIASKIMAFSQQGPRTVCILSANGAICNVTLRQPAMSGGTVTYEGRFEIISLSGSFLLSENSGSRSRTGGLSVSLAGSDGRVLGGGVAGMLMAATPVQVVVGSFIADGKKPKSGSSPSSASAQAAPNMLSFGNPVMGTSPISQGGSSDSSDDNGSPIDRTAIPYGNHPAQPMQNIPMYAANMGWANSTVKMLPH